MDWGKANEFVAQHHLVPVVAFLLGLMKLVTPLLKDVRVGVVECVAIGRAVAKVFFHLTDEQIAAERPEAAKLVPEIPEPDAGLLAKLLGVIGRTGTALLVFAGLRGAP